MADGGPYRPTCGTAITEYGAVAPPALKSLAMVEKPKTCH